MNVRVLVHLPNTEPIMGDLETLPSPQDNFLVLHNPRYRDGRDIPYIDPQVMTLIIPFHHITMIEVFSEQEEEIISFVRE